MNPKYWMISNRSEPKRVRIGSRGNNLLGEKIAQDLSYWVAEKGPLDKMSAWQKASYRDFKKALMEQANSFPLISDLADHDVQKHVTLFVHGYNNTWASAARRYEKLCADLFLSKKNLGVCVLFTWPSNGRRTSYYPDRADARRSAIHLSEVLNNLYDYLLMKQNEVDEERRCRAKTSIIAHSMGSYVLQEALNLTWQHNNQPMLVSLINQLVLVAADVDNDLFKSGESVDLSLGDAMAQLTYRITSLYTGRDQILGMSAGFKHFGKRRLGRSGIDRRYDVPDNVWDIDCSELIAKNEKNIHSAYFETETVINLMEKILRGVDRHELLRQGTVHRDNEPILAISHLTAIPPLST
ncbi:alpha/beta hydrolase [Alkalimonas amylolytica]|uniref:Esterase/lipase superfamily enzyme n=1 Tax=Alkalimonas amylolytica TaxID=152573 RepID=A0A1H4A5G0_ALKAM|nr:alpha/beta hydrolase [Alkalimonas amylolytica]SEA30911.1 Alpha/beta hydrolase of unknown function [Alkalimonas amylolytica]